MVGRWLSLGVAFPEQRALCCMGMSHAMGWGGWAVQVGAHCNDSMLCFLGLFPPPEESVPQRAPLSHSHLPEEGEILNEALKTERPYGRLWTSTCVLAVTYRMVSKGAGGELFCLCRSVQSSPAGLSASPLQLAERHCSPQQAAFCWMTSG